MSNSQQKQLGVLLVLVASIFATLFLLGDFEQVARPRTVNSAQVFANNHTSAFATFYNVSAAPGENIHKASVSSGSNVESVTMRRNCKSDFTGCGQVENVPLSKVTVGSDGFATVDVAVDPNEYVLINFKYGNTSTGKAPEVDLEVKTRNSANYSNSITIKPGEAIDFKWTSSGDYNPDTTRCLGNPSLGSFSADLPPRGTATGGAVQQGRIYKITCTDRAPELDVVFSDSVEVRIQPTFREF